jgi:predicted GH43/DUF377 family glycosyl hydrolase
MVFKWKKLGRIFNPVEIEGRFFMKEFAQGPATLISDDFVRVYFSCRPHPDDKGQYVSYSAFIDLDRKNLFKIIRVSETPILALGGLGTFDEFGTYPVSVIKYRDEYRIYYGGWTRCESVPFNVAIGMGISKDGGEHFEKMGRGPILSYTPDEPFVLSGPKIRYFYNKWYLFYIAGSKWVLDNGRPEPIYRVRMAISDDGISWEKHNKDLIQTKIGENEAQASPDVIFINGKYHMFFCYRHGTDYRNKERGYRVGYASSSDLINWERQDENAGIDISKDGWDSEMISYPHVFDLDDAAYMLYLGNQVGRYGFGIAILD